MTAVETAGSDMGILGTELIAAGNPVLESASLTLEPVVLL